MPTMKQKVIVFTERDAAKDPVSKIPFGNYNETALKKVLEKVFPPRCYDVDIVDYPLSKCFRDVNDMWMHVRTPILIGFGRGADYILNVKNYKRKYLISPKIDYKARDINFDTDEYDDNNTVCLFCGDEKGVCNAEIFKKYFSQTFSGVCNDCRDIIDVMDYIGIYDLMMFRSKLHRNKL